MLPEKEVSQIKNIILYSTGCPKCKVLEQKLDKKGIEYEKRTSLDEMLELGFKSAPVLSVDGEIFEFSKAVKAVNDL